MEEKIILLKDCQENKQLLSCSKCSEFISCNIRQEYIKAVYESMSKGTGGGFEF